MKENKPYRISVADMAPHIHSFMPGENKTEKLSLWLINFIKFSLESGKFHQGDFLPSKAELACHIGVSQGTMQTVYRLVEDAGWIESKQRIGSYIKNKKKTSSSEKLTSKREFAIEKLKEYIKNKELKAGDILISSRKLAEIIGLSNTTIRGAIFALEKTGILKKQNKKFIILKSPLKISNLSAKTLATKTAEKIKDYILSNLNPGDKLLPNSTLTKMLKVSSKTIHDAIKILVKEGLLYTRRGRYGTIVLKPAEQETNSSHIYDYEKIEHKIRHYIITNCSEGDKLPSIKEFAKLYKISEKTIKKSLDNLAEEGYLAFARGRYGGTFVLDIPQTSSGAYTWLALNSEYVSTSNKGKTLEN